MGILVVGIKTSINRIVRKVTGFTEQQAEICRYWQSLLDDERMEAVAGIARDAHRDS